jgi:hypothetical protein
VLMSFGLGLVPVAANQKCKKSFHGALVVWALVS